MYRARNEIPGGGQEGQVLTYSRGPQWATPSSSGGYSFVSSFSGNISYNTTPQNISLPTVVITGWTNSGTVLTSTITATIIGKFSASMPGSALNIRYEIMLNDVEIHQIIADEGAECVSYHWVMAVVPGDTLRMQTRVNTFGSGTLATNHSLLLEAL